MTGHQILLSLGAVFFLVLAATCSLAQEPSVSGTSPAPREKSGEGALPSSTQLPAGVTPVYDFKIVNTYPHDPGAFTQGLVFDNGFLLESTGLMGKSTLRRVELETGRVLQSYTLPGDYFAEGLTRWQDKLIQLTWKSGVAFVYDKQSFAKQAELRYQTEGWGITNNEKALIMSDGSAVLRFLNPHSFKLIRRIVVRDRGRLISNLNELEYIEGEIFANVWLKDKVARISPVTGRVLGWIDLHRLRNALGPVRNIDVLNGIAYDSIQKRIFVTGKLWPKLFEIRIKR